MQGRGRMIVGEEINKPLPIMGGDVVLIQDDSFHRVVNDGDTDLIFNCVFDGKRNH